MENRYVRFYTLTQNDYSHEKGCPAVCIGGALLFDKQQHRIVGQLKFRNLSKSNIVSLKVSVTAYDDNNNAVERIDEYVYQNINVSSGTEFGGNRAIVFSNLRTRRMSVEINDVIFDTAKVLSENNYSNKSGSTPSRVPRTSEKNSVIEQKIKSGKDANQSNANQIPKYAVVLTAVIIFFGIGLALLKHDNTENYVNAEAFRWNDIELGYVLPEPASLLGEIVNNSENSLSLYVYEIEEADYKTYVTDCIEYGYTVDKDISVFSYDAYNADGYHISLNYDDGNEKMQINADIVPSEEATAPDTLEAPYQHETTEAEEATSDECETEMLLPSESENFVDEEIRSPYETTADIENAAPVSESTEIVDTSEITEEAAAHEPYEQTYPEESADLSEQNTENVSVGGSVTVPTFEDTEGNLVWVPVNGGKKYHSKASCSNMTNPMQVTVEHAVANGYTPCKRCYG